jgi:predicted GIY-YIG superfamily endonuclease
VNVKRALRRHLKFGRASSNRLVFYESYDPMDEAIAREEQIKGGSRAKKRSRSSRQR